MARVGTLLWSCEDFLVPEVFGTGVWQSDSLPVEKEDEDDVDRIVLRVPL